MKNPENYRKRLESTLSALGYDGKLHEYVKHYDQSSEVGFLTQEMAHYVACVLENDPFFEIKKTDGKPFSIINVEFKSVDGTEL